MSALPEPVKRLSDRIYAIEEQARALVNRNPFFGTGIHPTGHGGMASDAFDGDIDTGNAGTTGWAFNNQKVAIGELILRPGIVGNDALTNPVAAGAIYGSLTNFSLSTTLTNIKTITLTVPPGFTQAAISVVARVYAINPHTSGGYDGLGGDYLYSQANIAGYNGYALPLAVSGSGGSGTGISPFSTVLPGLTGGGSVLVQIAASTSYFSWAANTSNTAEVSGSVQWFR
ncbi:hypothetical protein BJ986_000200 [Phycicoccus badiiscoriae]|uniref:Uncharacterized protein n=1 Tax=Pedococcus badiiscoriae TaxID=642776 RepID=A0A852W9L0_9MICO|nr:hypothetical protein [Pedococcus badiiscoriae]NYG05713.1 hypothetical protein [Pedococcus badiiscoriae]